ncbi:MAG: type-F conjugative transfer system protein TraW [Holosporales bacterium]
MAYILTLMLLVPFLVDAQDLGVFGPTGPILEEDIQEVIISRLKKLESNGELKKHQLLLQQKAQERIRRPPAVEGIQKCKSSRTFHYDPSFTWPDNLSDHRGRVFYQAGQKVNPLSHMTLDRVMCFLDGDDPEQVAWLQQQLKNETQNVVPILVKGSPLNLADELERRIFFDQEGVLTKKFGITAVPARVSQEGLLLRVEEIALEDNEK